MMSFEKGRPDMTDADYLAKLISRCTVLSNGCWEINGGHHKTWEDGQPGYGSMSYRGKAWRAHRLSFFLHNGSIDPALDVLHSCDYPPCCNPAHLSQGLRRDNIYDCLNKGRNFHLNKTHCPRGHAYAEHGRDDIRRGVGTGTKRACKICQRISQRKRAGWPEHLWDLPAQVLGQKPPELVAFQLQNKGDQHG